MKLKQPITAAQIAELVGARILGDPELLVEHLNAIHKVRRGSLIFVDNKKYYEQAIYSSASAVLIDKEFEFPPNKALLLVENPFRAYNELAKRFNPFIALSATISPSAVIGENTVIEPNVVIGDEVVIGNDCLIRANTTIGSQTQIGNRVVIQSNSVIGMEAFYFHQNQDGSYERWHTIGRVVIQDDVEIGAGCTIDRSVSANTLIGQGTKIDSQVHIGHGVEIGRNCLIMAQVGIAGKSTLQDNVVIFGQAGISENVVIGEGAVILSQAGVSKSIPGGKQYFGAPAAEASMRYREIAALRRLPEALKKWDKNIDLDNDESES